MNLANFNLSYQNIIWYNIYHSFQVLKTQSQNEHMFMTSSHTCTAIMMVRLEIIDIFNSLQMSPVSSFPKQENYCLIVNAYNILD